MIDASLMAAILDSLKSPILFANTEHTIVYMNEAAKSHYRGGATLLGSSLLDCHSVSSGKAILQIAEAMRSGEDERLITEDDRHRVYMRAVRSEDGELVGYYERYEFAQDERS